MKVQTRDGKKERLILTGMIVDPVVCGRVAARWVKGEGLFRSKWANLIGGWCVDFYRKYDTPPQGSIESIFESWADAAERDENTVTLVERFLGHLSDGYEEASEDINPDYVVDTAGEYFNQVRLEKLSEQIKGDIESGSPSDAIDRVTKWSHVEIGGGTGVDVLNDADAIREAFEHKGDPLVTYPGALGEFFDDDLGRDTFVAFLGATGRGKSWWLLDIAWEAMRQRRKVAFFEVGDMSQAQLIRRLSVRAAKHPQKPCTVKYPVDLYVEDGEAEAEFGERVFEKPLDWRKAYKAVQKHAKGKGKDRLRLSVHPNSSLTVAGMNSILLMWEREGWVPDVIVVDYADILAPPSGVAETRDQINATWKQLRALSQKLHCCVVTATQSDANSYNATLMNRSNFSEDRRKMDHVTGMIGINMTDEEKEDGIYRLNWLKRRDAEYVENKCVYTAGALSIGRPVMKSAF